MSGPLSFVHIPFLLCILPDRIPWLEADRGRHLLLPCPQREGLGDVRLMAAGSAATPTDGENVNYKIRGRGQTGQSHPWRAARDVANRCHAVRVEYFEQEDIAVAVAVAVGACSGGGGFVHKEAFDGEWGEGLVVGGAGFDPRQGFTCAHDCNIYTFQMKT